MKTVDYKSLGLVWALSVPSTVEEYDTLAKRPDACLGDAIDHEVYHGTLGAIRSKFASAIDAELKAAGIEVSWDSGKKDDEGEVVEYNEGQWINKAMAQSGKKITDFTHLQAKVLAECLFDPSAQARQAATPRKTPQIYTTTAESWIAGDGKPIGNTGKTMDVTMLATKLASLNPKAQAVELDPTTNKPTVASLARLIHANELRKVAEFKAAQVSQVASPDLL